MTDTLALDLLRDDIMKPVPLRHVSAIADVRSRTAFLRALLDEIERLAPAGTEDAVSEQLVEELYRLGYRCIETASALTATMNDESHPRVV